VSVVCSYTAAGRRRTVLVKHDRRAWTVVDALDDDRRVVERLTEPSDQRLQAEAIARDYAGQAQVGGYPLARPCERARGGGGQHR